MVRRGRLSKGCETCRKRKIKCDQSKPECSQCVQAGWICPQYEDAMDRMFQHQNVEDFSGLKDSRHTKPLNQPSNELVGPQFHAAVPVVCATSTNHRPSTSLALRLPLRRDSPPSTGIIETVKDRAIAFFLSRHVLPNPSVTRGYFEYLSTFSVDCRKGDQLSTSISAVALAAYANTVQSSDVLNQARRHLSHAIRKVNISLTHQGEAVKDSTVISIMLLSTFETITCRNQRSLVDCDVHLRGATTIIKLRGRQQFQSQVGVQLFLQMFSNVLLGCVQRSVCVPDDISELRAYASGHLDVCDPAWQLSNIVVKLAAFRAGVKNSTFSGSHNIIEAALGIDAELSSLAKRMPVQWQFDTILTDERSELAFDGCYHVYPDLWIAHIWNDLRTCRLLLHQEVCSQLGDTNPLVSLIDKQQLEISTTISSQMACEICFTVPQYSGYLSALVHNGEPPQRELNETISPATGTYFILWPLLNAGQAAASDAQREWIIKRLRYIGSITGILQAYVVAEILERMERIYAWD